MSIGMKCDLKSLQKASHMPKFEDDSGRAVICLSLAHSSAGVPILK